MPSAELTQWLAYERLHGPLLLHERIDLGFAVLTYYIVNLWSKKHHKLKEFLPPWYEATPADPLEGFKQLMALAEVNDNADNLDADG